MKWPIFILVLVTLVLVSCGSRTQDAALVGGQQESRSTLSLPYGGSLEGIELTASDETVEISVASVAPNGTYFRLNFAPNQTVTRHEWSGNENVLSLLVPVSNGADIGLMGLSAYSGESVELRIQLGPASRSASIPPVGTSNLIDDLVVEDLGGGTVGLSWTEKNTGDYNFDGLVAVNDLTPIGIHYQDSIARNLDGSPFSTEYWVDGDASGQITVSDLTPIGLNYLANVASYNVSRNGETPVSVDRSAAQLRPNLPPAYNVALSGSILDNWVVAAVDSQGNPGADSAGNTAVDLRARLTITGVGLFNLDGTGSGEFGPGRFSSRVIAPIDVVQRANTVGTAKLLPDGQTTIVGGLPRGQRLYVDFRYAPTINLADGTPRGALRVKEASKDGEDDEDPDGDDDPPGSEDPPGSDDDDDDDDDNPDPDGDIDPASVVLSSIPIDMPADGAVDADVNIDVQPNTGGEGYVVFVRAAVLYPGDDPDTVEFELSYLRTWSSRLVFATGTGAIDTDNDDDFDDEVEFTDDDRDCLSDDDILSDIDELEFIAAGFTKVEVEAEGKFLSLNAQEGIIRLFIPEDGIDLESSDELAELIIGEHSFKYNSDTEFENDIDEEPEDLLPQQLMLEDELDLKLYFYRNGEQLVLEPKNSLRLEKLERTAHGNPF